VILVTNCLHIADFLGADAAEAVADEEPSIPEGSPVKLRNSEYAEACDAVIA
jgi:hypothetical protein